MTCLGRGRVRHAVINRCGLSPTNTNTCFTQNWVMVAHIWVESKYRVLCVTTGNEQPAGPQRPRPCLFWTPSIPTHSQSLSSFLVPPLHLNHLFLTLLSTWNSILLVILFANNVGLSQTVTGLLILKWFSLQNQNLESVRHE